MKIYDTKKLALASLLGTISALLEVIPGIPFDIPFPLLNRVSWDLTGIPMMLSLMTTDLIGGIYTVFIGCSFIFLRGNVYGGIFKIIAELTTIIIFSLIRKNFFIKSSCAIFFRVLIMTCVNFFLLPIFRGLPESIVIGILPALAILNATQGLINIFFAKAIFDKIKGLKILKINS